jgi:phosphoribosylglycinamide formyltransferase-1
MEKVTVFASGTKTGGGKGFDKIAQACENGAVDFEIAAVVSNNQNGGVREKAEKWGIKFIYFPAPWTAGGYEKIIRESGAKWTALSGWLKYVPVRRLGFWWKMLRLFDLNLGVDPRYTINIHPALLSILDGQLGGKGMYGHFVHEAEAKLLAEGKLKEAGPTMHFVTAGYDRGPAFFEKRLPLLPGMSAETIGQQTNYAEHLYQAKITNMVVRGEIGWDGIHPESLWVPDDYKYFPRKD